MISVRPPAKYCTSTLSSCSLSPAGKCLACKSGLGDYSKLDPCAFILAFQLTSVVLVTQRQSKCNLVEGMTVLPTVEATAARLAPRLCPKAFYVILKGICVLSGYSGLAKTNPETSLVFVCEHMM